MSNNNGTGLTKRIKKSSFIEDHFDREMEMEETTIKNNCNSDDEQLQNEEVEAIQGVIYKC